MNRFVASVSRWYPRRAAAYFGRAALLLLAIATFSADSVLGGEATTPQFTEVPVNEIQYLIFGIDSIPPIYHPEFVSANDARLHSDELIMGVSINGDSRAYPVWLMRHHEIVNDVVGGIPVLITWCPICFSGAVYARNIEGITHKFGNLVALYKQNLTMYDHETGSVWSQIQGRAIRGELAGTQLPQIPAAIETWGTWTADRPGTLVLEMGARTSGPEEPRVSSGVQEGAVIGIEVEDHAGAFYLDEVRADGVVNEFVGGMPILVYVGPEWRIRVFNREAGGHTLTFTFADGRMLDRETGSIWDPVWGIAIEGELMGSALSEVPFLSVYDWSWRDFHPNSSFFPAYRR